MELLLGCTDSEELKKVFPQTDIAKTMIRQLENEDSEDRELILQVIINLSGDEKLQKTFISLNSIQRICNLLWQRIEKDSSRKDKKEINDIYDIETMALEGYNFNKNQIDIKMVLEKYIVNPESIRHSDTNLAEVPYYLMILTNLTILEEGQQKFLNLENEKIKGVIFMKMLDKFFHYIYNEEFNFCSNLIANISSLKEGRTLILEYKIFKIFLIHLDKMNNFKIVNTLRVIRNCCFEFEAFKEELLVKNAVIFSYLTKILILTNITEKKQLQVLDIPHIDEIYFPNFNLEQAVQDKETINDLIIDILLILTNIEEAITHMKQKDLYKAFSILKSRLGDTENIKDRLFVINNYLEN